MPAIKTSTSILSSDHGPNDLNDFFFRTMVVNKRKVHTVGAPLQGCRKGKRQEDKLMSNC